MTQTQKYFIQAEPGDATSANPVHFLLVDDLEENLLSLEALLRCDGLVLLKARSGREALELLLQYDIGLALLDVQMPDMDGFELAELMRGTERTRRVPIIFLTAGSSDRQRRFRGYEAGAVDFLHKPIEPDILKSKAGVFFELDRQQRLLARQRDEIKAKAYENARLLDESRRYAAALQETDRRKDEFLAILAHELRNPLAPVRNGLQLLKMLPSADVAQNIREMMDRQLSHLVRLIDDLLDVSRVSEGKINLRKELITVRSVVDAAIEATAHLIEAREHILSIDMPEQSLWVEADLTRLAQIISNLLNNAAKYTEMGGHIELSVRAEEENVTISVSDNGLGIPADMLTKVFELFTQVNDNLERSQGGLGIGLALAQRLVAMHDGKIDGESSGPGKGSIFHVTLPMAAAPAQVIEAIRAPEAVASLALAAPLRVLVADDNEPSAKTMGWMLEMAGYDYMLAHDGIEALGMAQEKKPNVMLLDIGMPGMNGYDVCREVRKDPALKNVILIAQTGWGQERDRQRAREAGFDHHLVKPVRFEQLEALMSDIRSMIAQQVDPNV
jgi:signal transduction histidine kinase